jgi:hypothetical protein
MPATWVGFAMVFVAGPVLRALPKHPRPSTPPDVGPPPPALAVPEDSRSKLTDLGGRVDELLRLAEKEAADHGAEARRESEAILEAARLEASEITAAAHADAARIRAAAEPPPSVF